MRILCGLLISPFCLSSLVWLALSLRRTLTQSRCPLWPPVWPSSSRATSEETCFPTRSQTSKCVCGLCRTFVYT